MTATWRINVKLKRSPFTVFRPTFCVFILLAFDKLCSLMNLSLSLSYLFDRFQLLKLCSFLNFWGRHASSSKQQTKRRLRQLDKNPTRCAVAIATSISVIAGLVTDTSEWFKFLNVSVDPRIFLWLYWSFKIYISVYFQTSFAHVALFEEILPAFRYIFEALDGNFFLTFRNRSNIDNFKRDFRIKRPRAFW